MPLVVPPPIAQLQDTMTPSAHRVLAQDAPKAAAGGAAKPAGAMAFMKVTRTPD